MQLRRAITTIISLGALACATSHKATSRAPANGSGGAEFQLLPIDIGEQCHSNILKGTDRFKGTVYATPEIMIAKNASDQQAIELIANSDGYLLKVKDDIEFNRYSIQQRFPVLVPSDGHASQLQETVSGYGPTAFLPQGLSIWPWGLPREAGRQNKGIFVWGFEEMTATYHYEGTEDVDKKMFFKLPIKFHFSRLGMTTFSLKDIAHKNEFWDSHFDIAAQKITFKAKRDLGIMSLENVEQYPSQRLFQQHFFQEKWNDGPIEMTDSKTIFDEPVDLPTFRTVFTLYVMVDNVKLREDTPVISKGP